MGKGNVKKAVLQISTGASLGKQRNAKIMHEARLRHRCYKFQKHDLLDTSIRGERKNALH